MKTYEVLSPFTSCRWTVAGKFMLCDAKVQLGRDDGTSEIVETKQPVIYFVENGRNTGSVVDPRNVILDIAGRIVYSPKMYRSHIGGYFTKWLDENPTWPENRDSYAWQDVDDPRLLTTTPHEGDAEYEDATHIHLRGRDD